MPEQDGPEQIGRIGHPIVPLPVGGIPQAVHHAGDDHQNDQQHHQGHDRLAGAPAAIGVLTRLQIAQTVIFYIELIDPVKQAQHSRAELSGHGVLIQVAVQMGGHLLIRHWIVGPHCQIAVVGPGIHHQDAVRRSQLDLLSQCIGVVGNIAGHLPHSSHSDEAVIPGHPVGVIETDLLLLLVREHLGLVADPGGVAACGQRLVKPSSLRDRRSAAPPHLADPDGRGDHHHGQRHCHRCLLK